MKNQIYPQSKLLGDLLKQYRLKLATAESCTSGGLAYYLTAVSGSSAFLDRGFVTYSNEAKMQLLSVKAETLAQHGAVSEAVAIEMAQGVLVHSDADIAISVTGIAGPLGGSAEKPVGLVWFGFAQKELPAIATQQFFKPDRAHIRRQAIAFALRWAKDNILSNLNTVA